VVINNSNTNINNTNINNRTSTTTVVTRGSPPVVIVGSGLVEAPIAPLDPLAPVTDPTPVDSIPLTYPAPVAPPAVTAPVPAAPVPAAPVGSTEEAEEALTVRYLAISNTTDESVKVWIQYYAVNAQGEWVWLADEHPLERELKAGESKLVYDEAGQPVQANRVRIWAESKSGKKWELYKDQDLLLVGDHIQSKDTLFTFTMANQVVKK
jgi:hypothetical protein